MNVMYLYCAFWKGSQGQEGWPKNVAFISVICEDKYLIILIYNNLYPRLQIIKSGTDAV